MDGWKKLTIAALIAFVGACDAAERVSAQASPRDAPESVGEGEPVVVLGDSAERDTGTLEEVEEPRWKVTRLTQPYDLVITASPYRSAFGQLAFRIDIRGEGAEEFDPATLASLRVNGTPMAASLAWIAHEPEPQVHRGVLLTDIEPPRDAAIEIEFAGANFPSALLEWDE